MKKLLLVFGLAANVCIAQKPLKFDSVSVISNKDTIEIKCKSTIVYTHQGFTLVSSDPRIYSYLLPGIEFFDVQCVNFYDTGMTLKDSTFNNPIAIYHNNHKDIQVAQYVRDKSITLMKKDKTGIKFY